jgi:hypothetical protein
MYEQYAEKQMAVLGGAGYNAVQRLDENPTVGENIDRKIAWLKGEIDRLEKSKETLGPLLGMRIRDIRQAMEY